MTTHLPARPDAPLKIAISECLTGAAVRYDGSGARSSFPHETLGTLFTLVPVCPEMGIGMTVPRPPIRLVGTTDSARAVGVVDASIDVTGALYQYGQTMVEKLRAQGVCGYVFMKNSPSCGLFRVKVYPDAPGLSPDRGIPVRKGRGIYAGAVGDAWPALPLEECGRLSDEVICENFVTRVFAYAHWTAFVASGVTAAGLVTFHSRYKYLLMAHSVPAYERAGRLLSDLRNDLPGTANTYINELMTGLSRIATRGGHANVLSHLQGYFKDRLDGAARQELATLIEAYRIGEQPLLAVLALIQHYLRRYPDDYIAHQVYLDPHPVSAALRRSL